ncbi:DUF2156 domain-containing protein [Desulfatibacillum aliphaticivorans]|uniref:Cytoplasmic protein n=1 Tax=Desulfatibacillum aliphaticivorans TaxID=218208 RepID=B8FCG7_DESAL|nr:phosphatidylglycerol lysyltransferase domain-containing protein [Desulfatibacillum aliphaticivorans]ACL06130.1 putative cytoplasmic protein [Desulfatibacillum aliphaticivorans]
MNFQPVRPKDYQRVQPFFKNMQHELCAYSLDSMMVWHNEGYSPYWDVHDDALVVCVRFADKRKNPYMILPIAPGREFTPEDLAKLADKTGIGKFHFAPKDYIAKYGRERLSSLFSVRSHVEYHDYIYATEDLATLKGSKYSKKRNLINQFKKNYINQGKVEIQDLQEEHTAECHDFLDEWCRQRDCGRDIEDDLACEKRAVQNALRYWTQLRFKGTVVRLDGEVRAFAIGSHLTSSMGNLNFEKADAEVKGLYQYLDRESAARLFDGYEFINKESDMNLPGLAHAKQSYYPVRMAHSYKLILR